MAEMTAEYDEIQVPDGGVASFMMSDEDIAALEREEDQQEVDEVYGGDGISQFTDIASQMAALGRFGDDVIVHAQTGEIVIPKKIIDDNPEIRDVVFQAMMAQGIEDPEQYVVGSGSASINPETGLAEYGFGSFFRPVRRAVSSIAKSVKKVASKTVKVLKKVAPIVLPIALAMVPALGPIYGAALGSGIGTLMQGGSFKDALKSAALSGITSAAFTGFTGPGTFGQNVQGALADPGARFAQFGQGLKEGFTGQGFGKLGVDPTLAAAPTSTSLQTTAGPSSTSGAPEASLAGTGTEPVSAEGVFQQDISSAAPFQQAPADVSGPGKTIFSGMDSTGTTPVVTPQPDAAQTSFLDKIKTGIGNVKDSLTIGEAPKSADQLLIDAGIDPINATQAQRINAEAMSKAQSGGILGTAVRNAPLLALGTVAAKKGGLFDEPPQEDLGVLEKDAAGNVITGADLLAANRDKYVVNVATADPTYFQPKTQFTSLYSAPSTTYQPQTTYTASFAPAYQDLIRSRPSQYSPFFRAPVQMVKDGGEIFPRRTGGIMPDEGIPGKDSVRAMLMPGEFVMTTDAVKGAGGGDLNRGINRMYDVMANLERKGRMA